ncbi:hypothetical protein [Methyloglobulus sp.]|uniref:hypothetical protein n=1 Tax=Methyloglobulus sp. TaxID=2518622 RepID=UPI00398A3ACE
MKIQLLFMVSIICFFCTGAFAESGAAVTGLCKDGTSYTGTSKKGACRGHKGIKEWYGDKATAATTSPAAAKPTAASANGAATGLCKDGTPYTSASKKGACRGHQGLKEWYADKQAPAASEAATTDGTATGLCKDGTPYTGASKKGACRGHKGIKEWYGNKAPAATTSPAAAEPTSSANVAATGLCKDGTPYTGASKKGACRGHKGLKEWYGDKPAAAASTSAPAIATPAPEAQANAAATALCNDGTVYTGASKRGACRGHKGIKEWYADKPAKSAAPAPATAPQAAAPAAGSGKVWVNTRSKIYHCEGSKFYGNTKEGEYMSEVDAQAKGYNANRKKVCN